MKNLTTGRQGESAACAYLSEQGYRILRTNYRAKVGEIDIIAQCPQNEYLVFIEVKTRTGNLTYGAPSEAVTLKKRRKIIKAALYYLTAARQNAADVACRFDILEIIVKNNALEYNHIINAFGES
ncbi:MAG: YraN family protein [Sporomusaceae bacterium]|jgi:putative endonuclease|nr:YraN family protein [Sporomusaceae bacterium]